MNLQVGVARHHHRSDIIDRWVDSLEKAIFLLRVRDIRLASERMEELFEEYPEAKEFTHIEIAGLIGVTRETVSVAMNRHFGIYRVPSLRGNKRGYKKEVS